MVPPNGRGVALPPSSGAACGGSRIYTQRWKATIGLRMGSPSEADQALRVRGSKTSMGGQL
jgi:hypothetical protein